MEVKQLVTNLTVPNPHSHLKLRVHALEKLCLVLLELLQGNIKLVHLLCLHFVHHIDDGLILDVLGCLHIEAFTDDGLVLARGISNVIARLWPLRHLLNFLIHLLWVGLFDLWGRLYISPIFVKAYWYFSLLWRYYNSFLTHGKIQILLEL